MQSAHDMNMENVLSKILHSGCGERFYRFANADGKAWIMPAQHMHTAMELYQPSSLKGRLLKLWFPFLHRIQIVRWAIHAERMQCQLSDELQHLLERIFNIKKLEFALFCGTPCVYQKITMQVFQDNRIIGYVKFSRNVDVAKLFRHESDILTEIRCMGLDNVPEPKFCSCVDGTFVFMQTTSKTRQSITLHRWTELHQKCLENIVRKTKKHIRFDKTDYANVIRNLQKIIKLFEENDQYALNKGIQIVLDHYRQSDEFCFFHGDFTPWNIYIENKKLYMFDMEYSYRSFPLYMDMIHFVLQVCIQEKRLDAKQIIEEIQRSSYMLDVLGVDYRISIIAYLLFILTFYMQFFNGKFDSKDNGYRVWTALLKYYIEL